MDEGMNELELASGFVWITKDGIGSYVGDLLENFNQEGKALNGSLRKQEGFVAVITNIIF